MLLAATLAGLAAVQAAHARRRAGRIGHREARLGFLCAALLDRAGGVTLADRWRAHEWWRR